MKYMLIFKPEINFVKELSLSLIFIALQLGFPNIVYSQSKDDKLLGVIINKNDTITLEKGYVFTKILKDKTGKEYVQVQKEIQKGRRPIVVASLECDCWLGAGACWLVSGPSGVSCKKMHPAPDQCSGECIVRISYTLRK